MLRKWMLAGGALFLVPALGAAQAGGEPAAPLKKVEQKEQRPEAAIVQEQEVRALVKALSSENAEERERAEARLQGLGPGALPHLGKILGETTDPVLWDRIHRALVRISGVQEEPGPAPRPRPGARAPVEEMLEEMEARLKRIFGELEGRLDRMPGGGPQGLERSQQSTVQMQIGPEGVEVKITKRDESGKEDVQHYKAKDIEEFKRLYPEVARAHGIGEGGATFRIGPRVWGGEGEEDLEGLFERMRRLFGRRSNPAERPWTPRLPGLRPLPGLEDLAPVPSAGERLGVVVRELSPDLGEYLGLEPGRGLLVDQVMDGSLAAQAGLRPRDILLAVAGAEVAGVASIQQALRTVPGGEAVEIVVLRGGEKVRLKALKEHAPAGKKQIKELRKA